MFAGNFAPAGWMFCDGQQLAISENETLFQLIGTTYGGDGEEFFALPDLRSRLPMHSGNGYILSETLGTEEVTLTVQQIPQHSHAPVGDTQAGTQTSPENGLWAASTLNGYGASAPDTALSPIAVGATGGSQPHSNMPPFLAVSFIISLFGVFPSPT